jgi:DnaJ-class molecular chaperone
MPVSQIIHGDCVAEMAKMPEASVDAVVCNPPQDCKRCVGSGIEPGAVWPCELCRGSGVRP